MLLTIQFEIQGVAALIQNNPDGPPPKPVNPKRKHGDELDEDWRERAYHVDGGYGHPSSALKLLLMEAGSAFDGKTKRATMKKPIKQGIFMDSEWLKFTNRDKPDGCRRMRPRTSNGLVTYYAPEFSAGWKLAGSFKFDDEMFPLDRLKAIFDFGGERIGIGAHRPDFGRFIVTKFEAANGKKIK